MTSMGKNITISNQSNVAIQDILLGISKLETSDIENFMLEIGHILATRKMPNLEKKEARLLKAINNSVPIEYLEHYRILAEKAEQEQLSSDENELFLDLHEKIQTLNAKRFKKITALAHIQGVNVPTIMEKYQLYSNVFV